MSGCEVMQIVLSAALLFMGFSLTGAIVLCLRRITKLTKAQGHGD